MDGKYFGGYSNVANTTRSDWPSATCRWHPAGQPDQCGQVFERRESAGSQHLAANDADGQTSQGMFLSWNTQPGLTYQVQVTTNFTSWSNLGSPRFASGTNDSIYVGGGAAGYLPLSIRFRPILAPRHM
jgi:hypothetical protein